MPKNNFCECQITYVIKQTNRTPMGKRSQRKEGYMDSNWVVCLSDCLNILIGVMERQRDKSTLEK